MGLGNWIPGFGSTSSNAGSDDSIQINRMYLADEAPWKRDYADMRIMIGPDIESETEDWAVYRCTEDGTQIPVGTKLYVFEQGDMVVFTDKPFQIHLAQLVQPGDANRKDYNGYFVDFPTELTGETLPERTPVSDEELSQFLLSVSVPE